MTQGDNGSKADDVLASILTGSDTVDLIKTKSARYLRIRSGGRTERSLIEKKLSNIKTIYSGIAFCLWKRIACESGAPLFESMSLAEFEKKLDYTKAVEIRHLIRQLDKGVSANPTDDEHIIVHSDEVIEEWLLSGPDTLYEIETSWGATVKIRSGSLSQRNLAEQKLFNTEKIFDGVAFLLWRRLAKDDGTQLTLNEDGSERVGFAKFAGSLNHNRAIEMNVAIRKLDNGDLYEVESDEYDLDDTDYESQAERLAAEISDGTKSFDDKVMNMGNS